MAILENIRNKAGVLVTIIIGLALVAFILGDILNSGSQSLFSSSEMEVATVGDQSIPVQEFDKKVNEVFKVYQNNNKDKELDEATAESLREQTWNDMIETYVMSKEYEDLGINISNDELKDMVVGSNIHPIIQQVFGDPQTGQINTAGVQNFLENLDGEYADQKPFWLYLEKEILRKRKMTKFTNLVKKAVYVTNFEAEKALKEKNHEVNFDFVAKKYSDIVDSTVTFTDAEINSYYKAHLDDYEQEAERGISYVTFEVKASADDNLYAQKWINDIVAEFTNAENDIQYVNFNSDVPFDNKNYKKGELVERLDTIMFDQEVGYVYGPYYESETYKLAKLSEINFVPDSVKASHILIRREQDQNLNVAARATLDSLKVLVEGGADFAELAKKHSADGSAPQGGDLGWFKEGAMVPQFNDACFAGDKGDLVIVDTQFGTHLIQITDKGKEVRKVKVGIIERLVEPSTQTEQDFYALASKFGGTYRTEELFNNAITEQNLNKLVATLRENDKSVPRLESSRKLVRWAFEAEKGEVSDVFELGNRYVVAVVTGIKEKGVAPLDQVKGAIENEVRKAKKAEMLINDFNEDLAAGTDLAAIAQKHGLTVEKSGKITFTSFQIPNYGMEHGVIGAACSLEKDVVSEPIEGLNGVYIVKVTSINEVANENSDPEKTRLKTAIVNRVDAEVYNALKENANITDLRSKFY